MRGPITYAIAVKTPNPANGSHGSTWTARTRKREQRKISLQTTKWILYSHGLNTKNIKLGLIKKILLTRVAPSGGLDEFDNLGSALKSVADGIADALGCKNDRVLPWDKKQRRGKPGEHYVEVTITFKDA